MNREERAIDALVGRAFWHQETEYKHTQDKWPLAHLCRGEKSRENSIRERVRRLNGRGDDIRGLEVLLRR